MGLGFLVDLVFHREDLDLLGDHINKLLNAFQWPQFIQNVLLPLEVDGEVGRDVVGKPAAVLFLEHSQEHIRGNMFEQPEIFVEFLVDDPQQRLRAVGRLIREHGTLGDVPQQVGFFLQKGVDLPSADALHVDLNPFLRVLHHLLHPADDPDLIQVVSGRFFLGKVDLGDEKDQPVFGKGFRHRQHGFLAGNVELQHHARKKHQATHCQHRQDQIVLDLGIFVCKNLHVCTPKYQQKAGAGASAFLSVELCSFTKRNPCGPGVWAG